MLLCSQLLNEIEVDLKSIFGSKNRPAKTSWLCIDLRWQMLTKVHVWYLAVYLASLNGVQKYRDDPVALDAQNFQATKAVQIL